MCSLCNVVDSVREVRCGGKCLTLTSLCVECLTLTSLCGGECLTLTSLCGECLTLTSLTIFI